MTLFPLLAARFPLLAAGIVDKATADRLQRAMNLVPPRYLFYAAIGLFFAGLLLRGRASGWLWGSCLAVSVLATVLWVAAMLVSLFFHRNYVEHHPGPPAAASTASTAPPLVAELPCARNADCPRGSVCSTVSKAQRCRPVCAHSRPCPAGSSCVVPEAGPTVCFPDALLPH